MTHAHYMDAALKVLPRLSGLAAILVVAARCGDTVPPTSPTPPTHGPVVATAGTPPPAAAPADAATPPFTLSGPTGCVTAPSVPLEWLLTVNDAGRGTHVVTGTAWDVTPGCDATNLHRFTGLAISGLLDYPAGTHGETAFTFNPAQRTCGRTQVDLSLNDDLILGMIVNTGRTCPPPKP